MNEYPNFTKLSQAKREKIMNAGFMAFGKNGYEKTSMNDIAKLCGVSKASLFHYFENKMNFYLYLYCFASNKIIEETREGNDDFFDCLWLGSEIKLRVMKSYQGLYAFLLSVVKEENEFLLQALKECNQEQVHHAVGMLFKNVNWNKLKPEIDQNLAMQMVTYVSNGFVKDHADQPPEIILAQLKPILELLKTALYQEEYI